MNELAIGGIAVVVMTFVLLVAVTQELAPAGGLTGRGRWLLAAGLGMGVVTFAMKLLLIVTIELAPPRAAALGDLPRPAAAPTLLIDQAGAGLIEASPYHWEALPREAPAPEGNPTTPEKVALGKQLFFDRNLSLDRSIACASCHQPFDRAGADGRAVALGVCDQRGARNAPTVWNSAFQALLFWDGRAESLEEQAKGPLVNPREMAMPSLDSVVERVREQPGYRQAFVRAFGSDRHGIDEIAAAIAAYERTLVTPDTPYDRFVRGDSAALDARQLRGMALFEAVGCVQCHSGPNFSGASLLQPQAAFRAFPVSSTVAIDQLHLRDDPGRAPGGSARGVWRIPSLRNVALTAPYFHNGSVATLEEAVRIMASVQLGLAIGDGPSPTPQVVRGDKGHRMRLVSPRSLSERDVRDIAAFLESLSDPTLASRIRHDRPAGGRPQPADCRVATTGS